MKLISKSTKSMLVPFIGLPALGVHMGAKHGYHPLLGYGIGLGMGMLWSKHQDKKAAEAAKLQPSNIQLISAPIENEPSVDQLLVAKGSCLRYSLGRWKRGANAWILTWFGCIYGEKFLCASTNEKSH